MGENQITNANMNGPIRVLLADDHAVVRDGLARLLQMHPDITVVGAAYLVLICLIPEILVSLAGLNFVLGGTSLLIVVNVTMDTVSQIQSHLIAHQYGDLIKKAKLKTTPRRR